MKRKNFSIHLMNFLRFKECGSMIKKFLNAFMCIGLLMQNFLFVIPVMAEEVKNNEGEEVEESSSAGS